MGFDVTFHPISPKEMNDWYFQKLELIKEKLNKTNFFKSSKKCLEESKNEILKFANQYGIEPLYAEKYFNVLKVGTETKDDDIFDKTHGFYMAVVQGFFREYYYTRGSAFSFLIAEKPEYIEYTTPWEDIIPHAYPNKINNNITENYCSGVYIGQKQVIKLLDDIENNTQVYRDMEALWSDGQLDVLKKALSKAKELECGILEATDVITPNPIRPNESECFSDLFHCDKDGVYLYIDTAMQQLSEIMKEDKNK